LASWRPSARLDQRAPEARDAAERAVRRTWVEERVSPTRITEWSDLVANAVGIGIGLALVIVITIVSGLPARTRRRQIRRR